jgi:hypothetical protein
MNSRLPRILLTVSAAILLFGSYIHSSGFKKIVPIVSGSNLPAFYGNAFKALWLIDSVTLALFGVIFALIAMRIVNASHSLPSISALIPAGTSILLYIFIGMFIPAHMLLVATILVFIAGLMI